MSNAYVFCVYSLFKDAEVAQDYTPNNSGEGMRFTTHLHPVLRLGMSRVLPLLLLYTLMASAETTLPFLCYLLLVLYHEMMKTEKCFI
jgi:hypothetical protein